MKITLVAAATFFALIMTPITSQASTVNLVEGYNEFDVSMSGTCYREDGAGQPYDYVNCYDNKEIQIVLSPDTIALSATATLSLVGAYGGNDYALCSIYYCDEGGGSKWLTHYSDMGLSGPVNISLFPESYALAGNYFYLWAESNNRYWDDSQLGPFTLTATFKITTAGPPPGCKASDFRPKKCEAWRPDGYASVALPAALPLLVAGLGGLGFMGRRKKKTA